MDSAAIIKNQLKRVGNTVYIHDGEWHSMPIKAVVQHLWRKNSTNFESTFTELGKITAEYYLYIGPASCDITALGEGAELYFGTSVFEFKCRDAVSVNGETVYYTGILRKIREEDDGAA